MAGPQSLLKELQVPLIIVAILLFFTILAGVWIGITKILVIPITIILIICWILTTIAAVVFYKKGLIIVHESHVVIIQRFGKHRTVLQAGLHVITPFIDKPKKLRITEEGYEIDPDVKNYEIGTMERVLDPEPQRVITKDNLVIMVDAVLYYRIDEPERTIYEITDVHQALNELIRTILMDVVGDLTLDDLVKGREEINEKLQQSAATACKNWGITINKLGMQDIQPPVEMVKEMQQEAIAERARRALVTKAEGEHDAILLKATAEAEALEKIKSSIREGSNEDLIRLKTLEALGKVADGKATKVFLPAGKLYDALAGVTEMFDIDGKNKISIEEAPPTTFNDN